MTITSSLFEQIAESLQNNGVEDALQQLADSLEKEEQFHELFEARKMQLRHRLGLPLLHAENSEELDEPAQIELENELAEACREIGGKLLASGRLREGWMYLRPVAGNDTAKEYLGKIEINDENLEEVIEIALREGVDPGFGFSLVLKHYGTCNSITTFDAEMTQHPRADQQVAAGMLVEHLHEELLENVKSDIQTEEGSTPDAKLFAELLSDREWLFDGNRYHIDTTHLASVVRFARILTEESQLKLAADLTEYGKRLSSQYQYENEEPFAELYPASKLYFDAVLGNNIDEAKAYFKQKAEACDTYNDGYLPVEVYVEFLSRTGDPAGAIEALIKLMPDASPKIGIAPNLVELSTQADDFDRFTDFCKEKNDLLGFVTGLLHQQSK